MIAPLPYSEFFHSLILSVSISHSLSRSLIQNGMKDDEQKLELLKLQLSEAQFIAGFGEIVSIVWR